jgi:hypothetical protein
LCGAKKELVTNTAVRPQVIIDPLEFSEQVEILAQMFSWEVVRGSVFLRWLEELFVVVVVVVD